MIVQGVSISEMLNQSTTVLTKPSVASFEQFEKRGGMREALIYVVVAAVIAGVLAFVLGLTRGIGFGIFGLITTIVVAPVGFFVFAFVLNFMGKQQGSTGTQDEVFYTCALFAAPILAISGLLSGLTRAIPFVGLLLVPVSLVLFVYQCYLAYLAARSSLNLDQNKAIISVVVAIIAQIIAGAIIGAILGVLLAGLIFASIATG
jgi:hypothetical protein